MTTEVSPHWDIVIQTKRGMKISQGTVANRLSTAKTRVSSMCAERGGENYIIQRVFCSNEWADVYYGLENDILKNILIQ